MAMRMMNGSMKDLNCAIRIRYTISTEMMSPSPNSRNDRFMLTTAPRTFRTVFLSVLVLCQQFVNAATDLSAALRFWSTT